MRYLVVNTDNFGGDYPNEHFVGEPFASKEEAENMADTLNGPNAEYNSRYHKVVEEGYQLQPGFEP